MGKQWRKNDSQKAFLQSRLQLYLKAKEEARTEPFLASLHEDWFIRWPEREALFGAASPEEPLTAAQLEVLKKAIVKRKEVSNTVAWAFCISNDGT
jgi:hypothetical protein